MLKRYLDDGPPGSPDGVTPVFVEVGAAPTAGNAPYPPGSIVRFGTTYYLQRGTLAAPVWSALSTVLAGIAGTDYVAPGVTTVGQILAAVGSAAAPGVQVGTAGGLIDNGGIISIVVGGVIRAQFSTSSFSFNGPYIAILNGGVRFANPPTKTANYTLAIGTDHTVLGDATGGVFDFTLPDASTIPGAQFTVKRINAGGNAVTVKSAGGTIDGVAAATGIALTVQWQSRTYESNGTNWFIVGGYL
jgi:hypothetical protein